MRGVVSAGMVTALETLGLRDVFDAVYGASAGAIIGAYFLTGQAGYGTTIYYEDINNRKFISLARILRGEPVLSLEFLLDHVCERVKVLDWPCVLGSPIPLTAVASSAKHLRPHYLSNFSDKADLKNALRASARIPLIAGPPVPVRGDSLLDASIFESIPYPAALADGCTHVLVLLTRPTGVLRGRPSALERLVLAPLLKRYHPELPAHYLNRSTRYARDVARITRDTAEPDGKAPFVYGVSVARGQPSVAQMEKRRRILVEAAKAGAEAVFAATVGISPQIVETLTAHCDGHALLSGQQGWRLK